MRTIDIFIKAFEAIHSDIKLIVRQLSVKDTNFAAYIKTTWEIWELRNNEQKCISQCSKTIKIDNPEQVLSADEYLSEESIKNILIYYGI